jgi:hypothetical protein
MTSLDHANSSIDPAASQISSIEVNPSTSLGLYPHLRSELQHIAAKSTCERAKFVLHDIVIQHPNVAEAYNFVDFQLFGPRRTRAKGLLLTGPLGSGKTTFGNLIKQCFSPSPNDRSVIMISVSGLKDMRGAYGRVIESLDGPVSAHMHTPDRELAAQRLLRECKCVTLILDEIQDVLNNTVREQRRTLQAVKFLMLRFGLPVIALGTEDAARALMSDPHLQARFTHMNLPLWQADNNLLDLLRAIEVELPLRKVSELATEEALGFLVRETGGLLDGIMTIIRHAALHAMLSGEERITMKYLKLGTTLPNAQLLRDAK